MPTLRHARVTMPLRIALVTLLAALAQFGGPRAGAAVRIGRLAPPLIVRELNGRVFNLARERGRVVLVNFWATWCSPCRAEMPRLEAFYRRYRRRGLVLIGVSIDAPAGAARVRRVMRQFTYPAALAGKAKADGFGEPLAVPMTYVIDARGIVRARLLGGLKGVSWQRLKRAVTPLLGASKRH